MYTVLKSDFLKGRDGQNDCHHQPIDLLIVMEKLILA